jgi:hypothetical protein
MYVVYPRLAKSKCISLFLLHFEMCVRRLEEAIVAIVAIVVFHRDSCIIFLIIEGFLHSAEGRPCGFNPCVAVQLCLENFF